MNLKSLLQPTIDKICAEVREEALAEIRGEGRKQEGSGGWPREWIEAWIAGWEEGRIEAIKARGEGRSEDIRAWETRLQEQIRAGKIILNEDLELPIVGSNYPRKYITVSGEIREF